MKALGKSSYINSCESRYVCHIIARLCFIWYVMCVYELRMYMKYSSTNWRLVVDKRMMCSLDLSDVDMVLL